MESSHLAFAESAESGARQQPVVVGGPSGEFLTGISYEEGGEKENSSESEREKTRAEKRNYHNHLELMAFGTE